MSTNFLIRDGVQLPIGLPPYLAGVMFETFLYGLYIILFAICSYVLLRRVKALHWVLLTSAAIMFSLATADMVFTYYVVFDKLITGRLTFADVRPKYWLYVTNNVLADALLLYRCFVVWEFRKLVVLGPSILLIAGTVCGYLFEASSKLLDKAYIYLVLTLILNVILTCLTAGRIWWLARKARQILGVGLRQRYNATITILIESGLLYSVYIILTLALRNTQVINAILFAGLIQIVGIMPTLIIVQVGLGRAVHDVEANDAIARLESNKNAVTNRSYSDVIHCVRSREYPPQLSSSDTFINIDIIGAASASESDATTTFRRSSAAMLPSLDISL